MSQKRTIPRICLQCGAGFFVTATMVRQGRGKFCSKPCYDLAMREQARATLRHRLLARVTRLDNGCWQWTGCLGSDGYGVLKIAGRRRKAHVVAYELHLGLVPDGLVLDHLCRNRGCVNPAHLDPVTEAVNILRGESPTILLHRAGVCKRGHLVSPENTYYRKGTRQIVACRVCQRERKRRAREKAGGGRGLPNEVAARGALGLGRDGEAWLFTAGNRHGP